MCLAVPSEDIYHAVTNAVAVDEVGDHPVRWLVLGSDRAGNLLELVVMDRPLARRSFTPCQCGRLPATAAEGQARTDMNGQAGRRCGLPDAEFPDLGVCKPWSHGHTLRATGLMRRDRLGLRHGG
jgi:hypothetical protein